ncbi:MAG: hypothetical protein C4519_14445 [Desulfobacteraceae bacterium]|nr:MAG: hypothetical protein C4519_14445 [Desulfobacteraceae bacterium]
MPDTELTSWDSIKDKPSAGIHMCQIYSDDDERNDSLLKFLLEGFQAGERAACFSEKVEAEAIRGFLANHGLSYEELCTQAAFTLSGTREAYFKDNVFDPDRMLASLAHFHEESLQLGFKGARVIGEMMPEVQTIGGGDRLLEYECRVSLLLKTHPIAAVCQYDAHAFDGATIMDILKVHPLMVVRGTVVHNPLFIPPEQFLR